MQTQGYKPKIITGVFEKNRSKKEEYPVFWDWEEINGSKNRKTGDFNYNKVLEYVKKHGSITPRECEKHLGLFTLPQLIKQLKSHGHDFDCDKKPGGKSIWYYKGKTNGSEK